MQKIINWFYNYLWFHIWYKHTRKHKKDVQDTKNRVLEIRKKLIGK